MAAVVVHLVDRLLLSLEISVSNGVIGNIIYVNCIKTVFKRLK